MNEESQTSLMDDAPNRSADTKQHDLRAVSMNATSAPKTMSPSLDLEIHLEARELASAIQPAEKGREKPVEVAECIGGAQCTSSRQDSVTRKRSRDVEKAGLKERSWSWTQLGCSRSGASPALDAW